MRAIVLVVAWTVVALAVACGVSGDGGRAGTTTPTTPSRVSAPIDVASIQRTFHFAFHRLDDGTLVAGHKSHTVRVTAAGFSMTPRAPGPEASPLAIDEAIVSRGGGAPYEGAAGAPRVVRDGSLEVPRGALFVEHLENGPRGVEQSIRFEGPPPGAGDLMLRLPAHGEEYAGRTANGLHFVDRRTGSGVVYGPATWVDARGERTNVAARYEDGAIVLAVPDAVVSQSAYPATLDPSVSPEHGVDQPVLGAPSPGLNIDPAIDVEGGRYFVVWVDARTSLEGAVLGIHVAQDGTPIEPAPFVIAPGYSGSPSSPAYSLTSQVAVAFDGTNHLVVYQDMRGGNLAISAKRVSSAGAVLDATPLALSPPIGGADAVAPAVAFDGSDYMAVWADGRNGPAGGRDIFATRVSTGGSVLEASSIAIPEKPVAGQVNVNSHPKIALGGGGRLFIVWDYTTLVPFETAILGVPLTRNGVPLSGAVTIASQIDANPGYMLPDVAGAPSGFLVSYLLYTPQLTTSEIDVDAFNPDGSHAAGPIGSGATVPNTSAGTVMFSTPRLAFDGTRFILVYSAANELLAQAFTTSYTAFGFPAALGVNDDEMNGPGGAAVAASPGGAMSVMHGLTAGTDGLVLSAPVSIGADAGAGLRLGSTLSAGANDEQAVAVAHGGSDYLVTWVDERNTITQGADVYGVLLDANGLGVGGADGGIDAGYPLADAFPIVTTPNPDGPVRVAADAQGYLVLYYTSQAGCAGGVAAKRVSFTGQIIGDTAGTTGQFLTCTAEPGQLDVTWDGTTFLAAFADYTASPSTAQIEAYHVTGTTAGPPARIESSPVPYGAALAGSGPRVASKGGGQSLILWLDNSSTSVVGAFVGDPLGAPPPPVTITGGNVYAPAAAYDTAAAKYRVAWIEGGAISFASAAQSGTFSAPTRIGATVLHIYEPAIAFDGQDSLVAWTDERAGARQFDVYGARIDQSGALLDPQGFPIAADPAAAEYAPAMVAGGVRSLVTYVKFDEPLAAARLESRIVAEVTGGQPLGASCTGAADCQSAFCVDGVCCNVACGAPTVPRCGVCAAALGASQDGTCTAIGTGTVCRPWSGECQPAAECDGTSTVCPTSSAPDGTPCSTGVCESGVCVAAGSDGGSPGDAGTDAKAPPDAAAIDSGSDAAPATDAGGADASPDAGGADASADASADAPGEAGPRDSGTDAHADAAPTRDAGTPTDGGEDAQVPIVVLDAAAPLSADASFEPFPPPSGGCSCRMAGEAGGPPSTPSAWLAGAILLLAVVGGTARRRSSRLEPRPWEPQLAKKHRGRWR